MKLYDCKNAPNPRRVRIFINEKGLEIPSEEVSVKGGENLKEDYLSKNPWGLVPALELDDGTIITEVPAICNYLEAHYPDPQLLGTTVLERAMVISWERHMEFGGMQAISEVFRNSVKPFKNRSITGRKDEDAIPQLVERGRRSAEIFFTRLEKRLSESKYIAGENYSLADITALCTIDFGGYVDIQIPNENTYTKRWYEKVSSRPAVQG